MDMSRSYPHTCAAGSWRRVGAAALAASLTAVSPAWAQSAVTDWNATADTVAPGPPPIRSRILAMTEIAVHDALNSIDARYASYLNLPPAPATASPAAAVAAATYQVLRPFLSAPALATLTNTYTTRIAALTCPAAAPACVTEGVSAGDTAAATISALRANDGSATPHLPYTLLAAPGVYQVTPGGPPSQFAGWANVTPFAMNSGAQFRSDPSEIFDLLGEVYTREYNEVKRVGAIDAEALGNRTADQSAVARFWPGGGANWTGSARIIATGRGLDEWQLARLHALVNMALSDAAVSVFDTKYAYNFWRPVTAIRAGGTDGNPATAPDPAWLPFQGTPPYPDYTCGLTTQTGSAVEVLRRFFGSDTIAFSTTGAGMTRSYTRLSQAAAEAVDARVFGGMHFRAGCVQGVRQGEHVGRFVIQHFLKPLKRQKNPGR